MLEAEQLFERFENLMPFRVQDILLVSSLYDSFILREDGRLNELMIGESLELNLQHIPGISHVSSGAEALELVKRQPRFNLIVTNLDLGDMDAAQLAREVKEAGLDVPVVVLEYCGNKGSSTTFSAPQTFNRSSAASIEGSADRIPISTRTSPFGAMLRNPSA